MAKKNTKWQSGDVFVIKLKDATYTTGQVLDLQMKNVVRCTFFNERSKVRPQLGESCNLKNLISLASTTREQLDFGVWEIIGNSKVEVVQSDFPNEQFRENNWIGTKVFDASIMEEFLDAYYALVPWDDWADPGYLDKLLVDDSKKPSNLIYKNI